MDGTRISIYIVTYRNPIDLNNNIASILASGVHARIYVINNHSQFSLEPEHKKAVTVLHNRLRPDFSTGHLSRSWNQALLHGFQSLNNPASDIVITVQDDVVFKADWFRHLVDLHRRYNFITMGLGDAFCSYLPEAVKKIGMWDERFCSIGYQEGDYFLRSLIYNREHCSINDLGHGRLHNSVDHNVYGGSLEKADSLLISSPRWNRDRKDAHLSSANHYGLLETYFMHKWGVPANPWTTEHYEIRKSLIRNYLMYPYFEKDVEGLLEKDYLLAEQEPQRRWAEFVAKVSGNRES